MRWVSWARVVLCADRWLRRGAVARLVNYIAGIDYDTIDIHLKRDESRNVNVEQFLMLSRPSR